MGAWQHDAAPAGGRSGLEKKASTMDAEEKMAGENQRKRSNSSSGGADSEHSGAADDSKPPAASTGSPSGRASSGADGVGSPSGDSKSSGRDDSAPARPPSGAGAEQPWRDATPPPSSHQPQPKGAEERAAEGGEPAEEDRQQGHGGRQEQPSPDEGVERGAEHFKMVAARFRALMERRERRLEEAMSNPDTRRDLEVMFPGVKDGDYQTLLACVRGMGEEEDIQNLLDAARKRRREVCVFFFALRRKRKRDRERGLAVALF